MKETWQNFKKAAAITVGLTVGFNAKAQTNQTPETHNDSTKITKVFSQEKSEVNKDTIDPFDGEPIPDFNFEEIYNQDKEANDIRFGNYTHYLENVGENRVKFRFEELLSKVYVSVRDKNGHEEIFSTLEELDTKYPNYASEIKNFFSTEYPKHVSKTAWISILSEEEKKLSNNFENYVPSQEDLDLFKNLIERKNNGENLDGYDDIIRYINKKENIPDGPDHTHPEVIYCFYKKYNGDRFQLASYLTEKYFRPFVNK